MSGLRSAGIKRHCPRSPDDDKFSNKARRCGINSDGTVTLNILFKSEPYDTARTRAKRQIRCKLSDYPIDILKRAHRMCISALPIEKLKLKCLPKYNKRLGINKTTILLNLTEKSIGEVGISDTDTLVVYPIKTTPTDWFPLPLTGDDALKWLEGTSRKSFLNLVSRLEICTPDEASKIFNLIRSEKNRGCFNTETFQRVFPEKEMFADNFNWMLGNLSASLSDSYVRFYTKVEANVWQNSQISVFEKRKETHSQVLEAIIKALQGTKIFNNIVVGVILSFHDYRVMPLPYRVNAKKRFLLRKAARENWMGRCVKLVLEDVMCKAKDDIYTKLTEEISKVETFSFGVSEVSISYMIPRPYLRDALNRYYCNVLTLYNRGQYDKVLRNASKWVIETLLQYFKNEGYEAFNLLSNFDGYYGNPNDDDNEICGGLKVTCTIKPSSDKFS